MSPRLVMFVMLSLLIATPAMAENDWNAVDHALGRPGAVQSGAVHRYSFPRSDLKVTLDGERLKPALALGSWLAFEPVGKNAMVMGDLVLLDDEVGPVMKRLLDSGLTVTALHNHLLRSSPHTMYMHIHGQGDAATLARAVRSALELSATPLNAPTPASPAPALNLDSAAIDRLIGSAGKANGGVYQFTIPRPERISDGGMVVPPSMGLGIALNFQPTGGGNAVATGDFVLTAKEVAPVMRALATENIEVTALHNHLGQEAPRLFFMHFWAKGDALAIARGLRHALDATAAKPRN